MKHVIKNITYCFLFFTTTTHSLEYSIERKESYIDDHGGRNLIIVNQKTGAYSYDPRYYSTTTHIKKYLNGILQEGYSEKDTNIIKSLLLQIEDAIAIKLQETKQRGKEEKQKK